MLMKKIENLSVNERLCSLISFFPDNCSYKVDLGLITSFFYKYQKSFGTGVRFDWVGSKPESREIKEAYSSLCLSRILIFDVPSLKVRMSPGYITFLRNKTLSEFSKEEVREIRERSSELFKLLSR